MKTHTTEGRKDALEHVAELVPVIPIVRNHHERWDGTGYPDGLKGDAIPLMARIVAVVDTFDAMTTDRPYRKALSPEVAFDEIGECPARNSIRIARPHFSRFRRRSWRRCARRIKPRWSRNPRELRRIRPKRRRAAQSPPCRSR